jgi:Tol biopolymer transport system component
VPTAGVLLLVLAVVTPAEAAFPGQNGKIAYSYSGDIWTIEPDGTGATQLTTGPANDARPAWSPDGEQIAFERDGNAIYVMGAGGTGLHAVVSGTAPAWSPDGTRIAFLRSPFLHTIAVDGTDEQRVNARFGDCSVEHYPPVAWSPDGTTLATNGGFICEDEHVGSCLTTIATGAAVCVENGREQTYEAWSPDSRWILVGSCCSSGGMYYFGQGDLVQLTPGGAFDGLDDNAAWSPDGTTIVFRRDPHFGGPEPPQIYLIDAATGGDLRPLGGPHVGSSPDWQPIHELRRSDYKNAAHFCKAERDFLGDDAFRGKYGGGANAHGKCVSRK